MRRSETVHRRPFAWACLGLLLLACSERLPNLRSSEPIRLVEIVGEANVLESPLLDRAGPGEPERRPVFSESFDDFPENRWEWPDGAKAGIGSHGEPALHVAAESSLPYVLVIPVEGSRVYRIRRAVESWDRGVDLAVAESVSALTHPEVVNHPADYEQFRRTGIAPFKAIQMHLFPEPELGLWRTDEIEILTTPQTRSLQIAFSRPKGSVDAWIDDLSVELLELRASSARTGCATGTGRQAPTHRSASPSSASSCPS